MGLMRFRVPDRSALPADAVDRAYFTGLDEIPWRSRTQWTDEGLAIRRAEDDSGNFHIPWFVPGVGELSLQTGCLMERDEPYHLAVELARGTLNRIRNQLATWQSSGIPVNDRPPLLTKALELLSKAVTSRQDVAKGDQLARQCLETAHQLIGQLAKDYAENAAAMRRRLPSRATTALGINLGSAAFGEAIGRYVINTFNTAVVPFQWADIEKIEGKQDWSLADKQVDWSRANSLKLIGGPLLSFDRSGLPPWMFLYEGDGDSLVSMVDGFVRGVVNRYKGRIQLWQVAARMNVNDTLELGEEERLRLAAMAVETARALDPKTPISIVIDQPWGEYMRGQDCDYSSLHFADALVRADLGLSAIGLEVNLGYQTDSTHSRDALDFIRLVDRWSSLGLPLTITLSAPSSSEPDAKAKTKIKPISAAADAALPQTQARWIDQVVPLLLAKPAVQGILWNQLLDSAPHELAHAGLFDAANAPKPSATAFREVRTKFI